MAIANAVKMTDIYTVVIDGLPAPDDHPFLTAIRDTVQTACRSYAVQPVTVTSPAFPEAVGAHGAALFILDTFFQKPRLHLTT